MSLLPQQSEVNASSAFFAPASGGGGGGGPNLSLSSITFGAAIPGNLLSGPGGVTVSGPGDSNSMAIGRAGNDGFLGNRYGSFGVFNNSAVGDVVFGDANGASSGLVGINYLSRALGGGCSTIICGNTFVSSLTVSSINGAVPGGGGIQSTIANGAANISIPAGAVPMSFNLTEGASFTTPGNAGNLLFNGNITNNATAAAIFNNGLEATTLTFAGGSNPGVFMENKTILLNPAASVPTVGSAGLAWNNSTSNIQLIAPSTTSVYIGTEALGGNVRVQDSSVTCSPLLNISSPTAAVLTLNGGTNQIVARSDNTATATLFTTGVGGLTLSTVTSLNSHIPALFNPTPSQIPAIIQSGYCQDVPYGASTILFSVPYTTDNIAVYLTPTNRGTSGGANPNCSLANSYGPAGRGVSSIGFEVDTRNNGVGYNGSFYWMAMPINQ